MNHLGPAPLDLHLPAELAAVDPAALCSRAAEHRLDAEAAADQAVALRTAVVRLVPAAWLGLGALSFAGGALLQAGSLEGIAAAGHELAVALEGLAGRLEQARADASDTVRAGQRLDGEVGAENAAWSRRPEPERVDPDPARLAAQHSTARLLAERLATATEAAHRAWQQATASFDLVAYRMPALSTQMTGSADDGWRPSTNLVAVPPEQWRRLVGLSPVCAGAGWTGSGLLVGPDGRRYPVVVPWVQDDHGRWSADAGTSDRSVASLDGADPGWHEIGLRIGIDTFASAATTATKAAIITAGFVGNAPRMIGRLRPDLLPRLRWTATGVPTVSAAAAAPTIPTPRGTASGQIPRAGLVRKDGGLGWAPDTSSPTADRAEVRSNPAAASSKVTPAAPNLVGLTDSGLTALGTARRLDDGRTAAYRVSFEENDDGRTRARVTIYQVLEGNADRSVLADDVSVGSAGQLRRQPVAFRPAEEPSIVR